MLLLGAASLMLPIGSAIALSQPELALMAANPTPSSTPNSQCLPPPPMGEGPPPPPMGENQSEVAPTAPPWAKDLNLSDEQQERIQKIHEQGKKEMEELRPQLMAADEKMRSLLESDSSSDQLHQQHQQIQKLRQQADDKHFEMMLAERQVLTPEQRAQLAKLMPPHQGRGRP